MVMLGKKHSHGEANVSSSCYSNVVWAMASCFLLLRLLLKEICHFKVQDFPQLFKLNDGRHIFLVLHTPYHHPVYSSSVREILLCEPFLLTSFEYSGDHPFLRKLLHYSPL